MTPFGLSYCFNNGEVYKQSTTIACNNKKSQIKDRIVLLDISQKSDKAKGAFPGFLSYACRLRAKPLEVISQNPRKGKERLSGGFVLCLSGQIDPPPLFYMSSSGALRLEVISQKSRKGKGRLPGISVLCLSPQGEAPPLFYNQLVIFTFLVVVVQCPRLGLSTRSL
ncbi:hypothetical protein VL03_19965 [Rossellomorea marisflavi]|nr:hypothetical protein VL03_19965 [Rossellomorea marisflavi]